MPHRKIWLWLIIWCALIYVGRYYSVTKSLIYNTYFGSVTSSPATVIAAPDKRETYCFLTVKTSIEDKTVKLRLKTSRYTKLKPGDRFTFSGEIKEPPSASFDQSSEFNYKQYLQRFGITGLVDYPKIVVQTENDYLYWPSRGLFKIRTKLEQTINRLLPEPESSFLAGLLVGTRRSMPESTLEDLTKTGTIHIIAVSGANVVIIANLVLFILRYLTLRNKPSIIGSQITIWLFVLLTGLSAAAARGGLVSSLSQLTNYFERETTIINTLLLPAMVTLIINPLIYTDIGWQLSFAAFAGIILLPKWWEKKLVWLKLPALVKQPLIETTAASTGVLPISIYHFGALSLTTWVANPAILWLIPLAMGVGFACTVTSSLLPWLLIPLRVIAVLPLKAILAAIHLFALIPGSYYQV